MNIPVLITDNLQKRIKASLVAFQTVSRVYESDNGFEQEGIVFGVCIGPTGHFYLRKPGEMIAVVNGEGTTTPE